jgi:nucleoside-diphosphate-sugar epimerase
MSISEINNKKKVLVTGGTGFIGRALISELAKSGYEIFALVRKTSKIEPLKAFGVNFIYADITDKDSLDKVLDYKIDVIFHCAALVEGRSLKKLRKANVTGTENICRLALNLGVERVVYLSSVAVVSGNTNIPLSEDLPYSATNSYGISKIEAEKKVLEFRNQGLRVAILRPCMVYGEGEPHMLDRLLFLLKNRMLPVVDGGRNKLHLVYVGNVVSALMLALEKEELLSGAYFVADREVLTINELFSILSKTAGGLPPYNIPSWLKPFIFRIPYAGKKFRFFFRDRVYDISKIKALGYKAPFNAEESLVKSAWYWLKSAS